MSTARLEYGDSRNIKHFERNDVQCQKNNYPNMIFIGLNGIFENMIFLYVPLRFQQLLNRFGRKMAALGKIWQNLLLASGTSTSRMCCFVSYQIVLHALYVWYW